MAPHTLLLFLFLISFPLTTLSEPLSQLCEGNNYTTNSTFESNLSHLLSSLSLLSVNYTFNTTTQGSSPFIAYGLFLCRGDVGPSVCHNCVQAATQDAPLVCQNNKQVTLWYDFCELRYSDTTFYGVGNPQVAYYPGGPNATTDPDAFSKFTEELMKNVSYTAAASNSSALRYFATGELVYGEGDEKEAKIFGMAECTRDVSMVDCSNCLMELVRDYGGSWAQEYGGVLGKSCNFRYDVKKFFNGKPTVSINRSSSSSSSSPAPSPSAASVPRGKDNGNGHKTIIIISIVISLLVVFGLTLGTYMFFRKKSTQNTQSMARPDEISTPESLYYDLSVLKVATSNFSNANKLGQGGFGKVYKGILPNGETIAVKRLSASSRQGIGELKNELLLVAKLQHRNLVRLRGVCLEGGERLLVYEFMPNGSLDKFLFDQDKRQELNWDIRFKIIGGIARSLVYLHEEAHLKVVHRDLKASNVLLDANMKPKISDFGLARLFHDDTQGVTNRVVGTFGYMAPEYARRGQFSIKLDVYSYGILVLEIVTGKKNSSLKYDSEECQDLLGYAWEHWRRGTALAITDRTLGDNIPINEVFRCIQIGLLCAQEVPAERPSMSTVFFMLNSPSMPLQIPTQPTFVAGLSIDSDVSSNSKQSYFGSTGESSTNSLLSSQQSGPSTAHISQESISEEKKVMQSDMIINRPKKVKARASRLSQSETAPSPRRD